MNSFIFSKRKNSGLRNNKNEVIEKLKQGSASSKANKKTLFRNEKRPFGLCRALSKMSKIKKEEESEMRDDITTGGKVKKQPVPGMAFEEAPRIESKREAELLKARELIDRELEQIRKEASRKKFEGTREGKEWEKQQKEFLEQKKREKQDAERVHNRLVQEARRQYKLNHMADREKIAVAEGSQEFQDILKNIVEVYNLIQSHYIGK